MPRQPPKPESDGSQQERVFIVFVWGLCMNSSIFRRKNISSIGLVGILLLSSSSALSAEESSDSGTFTTLQGVTVTATRTEREAFDVPESVSIVDQQQIERE